MWKDKRFRKSLKSKRTWTWLCVAYRLTFESSSHKNATNITFIFETSPNTKPKDKKWGEHGILYPPVWKSGGTRSPCPPPNCAHDYSYGVTPSRPKQAKMIITDHSWPSKERVQKSECKWNWIESFSNYAKVKTRGDTLNVSTLRHCRLLSQVLTTCTRKKYFAFLQNNVIFGKLRMKFRRVCPMFNNPNQRTQIWSTF